LTKRLFYGSSASASAIMVMQIICEAGKQGHLVQFMLICLCQRYHGDAGDIQAAAAAVP
jgi:hypothetical protein